MKQPKIIVAGIGPGSEQDITPAVLEAVREADVVVGYNYIVLSDRDVDATHAAIPSLLAVSAVHHHLISVGKRVQTALVVESGEIREVMHAALLLGFGASALNPYMAFAVIDKLVAKKEIQLDYATAEKKYIKSICKGLFKIIVRWIDIFLFGCGIIQLDFFLRHQLVDHGKCHVRVQGAGAKSQ